MAFLFGSRFKTFNRPAPRIRVLMVCMGNICRSPTAEAVLRHKLLEAGLSEVVEVESAGTHAFHIGSPPDERSQKHARRRGYDLSPLRARRVDGQDFTRFDLLLAMDFDNLAILEGECPAGDVAIRSKLKRLTEFLPARSVHVGAQTVPDPYYGGPAGFDVVLDLVEAACEGLVEHLKELLAAPEAASISLPPRK
jgi:protein-tyrosine phosphatase